MTQRSPRDSLPYFGHLPLLAALLRRSRCYQSLRVPPMNWDRTGVLDSLLHPCPSTSDIFPKSNPFSSPDPAPSSPGDLCRHGLPGPLASVLTPTDSSLHGRCSQTHSSPFHNPPMAPASIRAKAKVLPLTTRSCWSCCSYFLPPPIAPLRPPRSSSETGTLLPQGLCTGCDSAWDHFHKIHLSPPSSHTRPRALSSSPATRNLYFALSSVQSMYSK